jgi:hypothetical protein
MTGKYMTMDNQLNDNPPADKKDQRPNDSGQILVEAFVRIKDPNTEEILVETRA